MEIQTNAPQTVIFRNADSFFRYCGWPSVCRDDEGVLYAACSGFRGAQRFNLIPTRMPGRTQSSPPALSRTWSSAARTVSGA